MSDKHRKLDFNFKLKIHEENVKNDNNESYFTFEGLASVFNNITCYGEIIELGAFKETIKEWKKKDQDLPMLWQHNIREPIGIFKELKETEEGLQVTGFMPLSDEFVKTRVIPQIRIGSINSLSIGFFYKQKDVRIVEDYIYLSKINLRETSLVTFPGNEGSIITKIDLNDLEKMDIRELENHLCNNITFSKNAAKSILSVMKKYRCDDDKKNERDVQRKFTKNIETLSLLDKYINNIKEL